MPPRTRKDRSDKLKARKDVLETVVKCCLSKVLIDDDFKSIRRAILERVVQCSKRMNSGTIALNLLIRELFSDPDKDVQVPEFWDQTFLRHLLLGTEGATQPNPLVADLYQRHPTIFAVHERCRGDCQIYSAAAIKLSANIRTHFKVNFPKVVKRFLYMVKGLNTEEGYLVQRQLYGWTGNILSKKRKKTIDVTKVNDTLREIRTVMMLENQTKVTDAWLDQKGNIPSMLKLFIHVNRILEASNQKMFTILPICKVKRQFITLDTTSMSGLLKDIGFSKNGIVKGLVKEQWASILRFSKLTGKNKTFTGTIETDGKAVCVHFQQPKSSVPKDEVPLDLGGKRVLGIDPGRTNIFTVVEKDVHGGFKTTTFSRRQYYAESGMFDAREKSARWNLNLQNELLDLSQNSPKTLDLAKFQLFIDAWLRTRDALWEEYTKDRWADQRFRLYGGKKRAFANFLNKLGPSKETVLAYGSAKFAPGGKGEMSVPTSRAFKECASRFSIKLVDEFRTSKICWENDSVLKLVKKRDSKGSLVAVRGLLWCGSTNPNEGKFVNRDLNGAINILRCAVLPERPPMLKRAKGMEPIVQAVGRIIKR